MIWENRRRRQRDKKTEMEKGREEGRGERKRESVRNSSRSMHVSSLLFLNKQKKKMVGTMGGTKSRGQKRGTVEAVVVRRKKE